MKLIKKYFKNKKTMFIFITAIIFIIFIIIALYKYFSFDKKYPLEPDTTIRFSDINYEYNIFDDIIYNNKNREVFYSEYGVGELLDETNLSKHRSTASFFYYYFKSVINGDYENYADYFTESFLKRYIIPEKFTMQKLYDIAIDLYTTEVKNDVNLHCYIVRFKIMNNNGSFRNDVGSDIVIPIVYILEETDSSIKIASIQQLNQN